jgi:peptidoglycan hydrolase CwlO-like protein
MDAATKQAKIAQLKKQIADAQERLGGHQADHERTQGRIDEQAKSLKADKAECESTKEDLKKVSEQVSSHTSAYKKTNEVMGRFSNTLANAKNIASQASAMVNVRGAQSYARGLQEVHTGPAHAKAQASINDVHDGLHKQISKLQGQEDSDKAAIKRLEGRIKEGSKKLSQLKGELDGHASKISACQQEIATYQTELRKLQAS